MKKGKNVLAIIPARGKSKGIPCKNTAILYKKPLIAYTINAAKKCRIFDKIIVSTDSEKIDKISKKYGAQTIKRPAKLAKGTTPTEPVIQHALDYLKKDQDYIPDIIILLQPTSPLRNKEDIKKAYAKFLKSNLDSLLSVAKNKFFIWTRKKSTTEAINYNHFKRPRRQDMKDQFRENGAIYITKYDIFKKYKNRLGGKIDCYVMPDSRSIEIDSPIDLLIAEQILRKGVK